MPPGLTLAFSNTAARSAADLKVAGEPGAGAGGACANALVARARVTIVGATSRIMPPTGSFPSTQSRLVLLRATGGERSRSVARRKRSRVAVRSRALNRQLQRQRRHAGNHLR